jgi:hypothetical protein
MKLLWIPIVVILAFSACKTKPDTNNVTPNNDTPGNNPEQTDSSYIVSGLTDINIGLYRDSAIMIIGVQHISGQQQKVSFSVSGMPDGITATLTPESGIPPFATTARFLSSYAKAGTYPIKFTGVSESGKENSYTIDMKVSGSALPCATIISQNTFNMRTTLPGSSTVISTKAFFYGDTRLQYMYLETLNGQAVQSYDYMGNAQNEIEFTADCDAATITIPAKAITVSSSLGLRTYTVSGSGTIDFNNKKLTINYMVVTPDSKTYNYVLTGDMYL